MNITDQPGKKLPKYIQEGNNVKARILYLDSESKILEFTLKPTLISEDLNLIMSYNGINKELEYYGTIVN